MSSLEYYSLKCDTQSSCVHNECLGPFELNDIDKNKDEKGEKKHSNYKSRCKILCERHFYAAVFLRWFSYFVMFFLVFFVLFSDTMKKLSIERQMQFKVMEFTAVLCILVIFCGVIKNVEHISIQSENHYQPKRIRPK